MSGVASTDAGVEEDAGVYQVAEFELDCGVALRPARLAWLRYGPAPANARAVVLLLHGISGSHQALRPQVGEVFPDAGWASPWMGQGGALDTRDTCVLVPNALGSCFGSSGPEGAAADMFPAVTIADSVRLQASWLRELGVSHLDAVIGYSYGGYQAFEWAVAQPPFSIGRVIVLASAPRGNGVPADVRKLRDLAAGVSARKVGAEDEWIAMRCATLQRYGYAAWLRELNVDAPEQRLRDEARAWAQRYSPWSLAVLRQAACRYDARMALLSSSTLVHWIRCSSDALFPPEDPSSMAEIPYPDRVRRFAVAGRFGHLSPLLEGPLWEPLLRHALDVRRQYVG